MAAEPFDGIQDPYLSILDLITSEYLNIYNREMFGLPESDRYDLTRSKWTDFYQYLEKYVFTPGFISAVMIVADIYLNQETTELKYIISFCSSITQAIVD